MAAICPICGEPHGKGLPNTDENPGTLVVDDGLEFVTEVTQAAVVDDGPVVVVKDAEVVSAFIPENTMSTPTIPRPTPNFDRMRYQELRAEAQMRNITIPFGITKKELLALLKEDAEAEKSS